MNTAVPEYQTTKLLLGFHYIRYRPLANKKNPLAKWSQNTNSSIFVKPL